MAYVNKINMLVYIHIIYGLLLLAFKTGAD